MSNPKVQDVKDTILVTEVSYLNNYYIPEYEKNLSHIMQQMVQNIVY